MHKHNFLKITNKQNTEIINLSAANLPARPRLCLALARLTHSGLSVVMLLSMSKFFSLILPQSITYTTSSIVMDVSAMLVAMMILRTPKK